jgi:hypothetical protein
MLPSVQPRAPSSRSGGWRRCLPRCRRGSTRRTEGCRASEDRSGNFSAPPNGLPFDAEYTRDSESGAASVRRRRMTACFPEATVSWWCWNAFVPSLAGFTASERPSTTKSLIPSLTYFVEVIGVVLRPAPDLEDVSQPGDEVPADQRAAEVEEGAVHRHQVFATPPDSPGQCEPGLSDDRPRDPRLCYCPELSPRATRSSSS